MNVKTIGEIIVWASGVLAAVLAIKGWITKPIKTLTETVKGTNEKIQNVEKKLDEISDDTADMLGDALSQAHDHWMHKGYCPALEKERLVEMHRRYSGYGRNHLKQTYEEDILELPEEPPTIGGMMED